MALFSKRYHPPGTAPGTLTLPPTPAGPPLTISLIDYTPGGLTRLDDVRVSDCENYLKRDSVTWVHIHGRPTELMLHKIAGSFGIHALALEDVVNSGQRPKIETFDDQLFIVMAMPLVNGELLSTQQISIFMTERFIVSFCEEDVAAFQPVIDRLQDDHSRLRRKGCDYLLYSLLDMVVDHGFPVLESFGSQLEEAERQVFGLADSSALERIHFLKRELIVLRQMLWPQREVINHLLRADYHFIDEETAIYFRDCYDHTVQVIEILETYRDMTGSMLEAYLSIVSNRMNQVMSVLTVIATIFIPLTFIVGVYGMNFDRSTSRWSMPELGWPFGYALVWFVMITIAAAMLALFRRKGWF